MKNASSLLFILSLSAYPFLSRAQINLKVHVDNRSEKQIIVDASIVNKPGFSWALLSHEEEETFSKNNPKAKIFELYREDVIDHGTNYLSNQFNSMRSELREGPGISGGGNSVVCFDSALIPAEIRNPKSTRYGQIGTDELRNHVTSITTYDLHFAQMPRGLDRTTPKLIQPLANETGRQYLERIARRFDNYMPAISALIRHGSMAFKDSNVVLRNTGLERIHDENDVSYIDPSNCVVATMAAQYQMGDESFLNIDDRLYSHPKHSRLSQYVLLLHEAIYNSVRTFTKQADSHSTRMLVSAILRDEPLSYDELEGLYQDLKLPYWPDLANAASALYNAREYNIWRAMNDKLLEIVKGTEHQQLLQEFNSLVKKHLKGELAKPYLQYQNTKGEPYYAGNIDMKSIAAGCAKSSDCYRDFAQFEHKMLNFQDRVTGALTEAFTSSLKQEVLLPLLAIPDANQMAISLLGVNLWSALQETNGLLGDKVIMGGGRMLLGVYVTLQGPNFQQFLEQARISTMIP